MPRPPDDLIDLLNQEDANRFRRRRLHRLEPHAYAQVDVGYCVTLCARHQGTPFEDIELAADVVASVLHPRAQGNWHVHAYCLMPDHLHLVVSLCPGASEFEPRRDLRSLIARFRSFTTRCAWRYGVKGPLWQRDFYDHIARNPADLEAQCHYALENPVRKGMVEDWREYPWSGSPDPW